MHSTVGGKGPPSERVGAAEGGSASARSASLRLDDNREKPKEAKINDDVEKQEFEVEDGNGMKQHPRWQTPQGKRKATKRFMSSYSSGHNGCCDEDGQCNGKDDGYWSGFARLVPHWP